MGGASTRVSNAIKGLKKRGHKLTVVAAFPHYPHGKIPQKYGKKALAFENNDDVEVIRVWVPSLPHKGFANRLTMYLSFTLCSLMALPFCGEVDVIWAASPNFFVYISGFIYKILKRASLVLDLVDLWPEALVNLGFLRPSLATSMVSHSVDILYKLCDKITTLHKVMRREVLKRGISSGKIHIVENVVDLEVFHPYKAERSPTLQSRFVVMYSGNLGPAYDFETVLEAARIFAGSDEVAFVLRGSGEYEGEIKKGVESLKLDNVLLLTEILNVERVVDFLNMADAFLLPMKHVEKTEASFPLKLLEYLACGKPVICCAEGVSANFVKRSQSGIVVKPRDAKGLVEATSLLLKDEKLRREFGKNGVDYVSQHFSCDEMGRKLENVFMSVQIA